RINELLLVHEINITSPSAEGKAEYSRWVVKAQRSIVAVLEDLSSFRPPLDYLLELLPRLQVRYYSISSSPK
uniref:Sulfite reductase [NADPH] flavoprotein alpha-component-like FAD-binding domain-containing protein n=1 Tax=Amphimedon queenslandica TaxID=400682 RepID=A0A1X7SEZ5_AMPQE